MASPSMEEMKVMRNSAVAVAPAIPTKRHRMFLSNLDFLFLSINNVQRLLFYRVRSVSPAAGHDNYSSMVDSLKKSLSSVLVYFYPLAGRLDKDESGRPEVDCNDRGVQFIEASMDLSFHHLENEEFQYKPFFQSLVPLAQPFQQQQQQEGNYNSPLLSVQVTDLGGEGICIGTTLHHVIADGNSFWHFMKSWAECSRGLPISRVPYHDRTIFKRENKSGMSISFKPCEVVIDRIKGVRIYKFMPHDPQTETERHRRIDANVIESEKWMDQKTQVVYKTFCFTEKMISDLKERSRASSSFVAVAAHFWKSVTTARQLGDEERVTFVLLADCRGRVKVPLISNYFGNCICMGCAQTSANRLVGEDVGFAAGVIEEVIKSCTATQEQLNHLIDCLQTPERAVANMFNEIRGSFITNVVSSPRFPVYEMDHGWGKPLNVQAASMNEMGGMVLFGARDGGGSILVSTRLPPHQMHTLSHLLSASIIRSQE